MFKMYLEVNVQFHSGLVRLGGCSRTTFSRTLFLPFVPAVGVILFTRSEYDIPAFTVSEVRYWESDDRIELLSVDKRQTPKDDSAFDAIVREYLRAEFTWLDEQHCAVLAPAETGKGTVQK